MSEPATAAFTANGRSYRPPPRPVVVVCLDGCGDEYLDAALARGRMPCTGKFATEGWRGFARAALPSFTNTNNASIATGVPPSVHGISGNFFLDPATGEKVMMNAAKYLRAPTIFAAASAAGRRVAVLTAKDKLREILSHGMRGISISAENDTPLSSCARISRSLSLAVATAVRRPARAAAARIVPQRR